MVAGRITAFAALAIVLLLAQPAHSESPSELPFKTFISLYANQSALVAKVTYMNLSYYQKRLPENYPGDPNQFYQPGSYSEDQLSTELVDYNNTSVYVTFDGKKLVDSGGNPLCDPMMTNQTGWATCNFAGAKVVDPATPQPKLLNETKSCGVLSVEHKGEYRGSIEHQPAAQTMVYCPPQASALSSFGTGLTSAIGSRIAFCFPLLLIAGLLISAMYYSGRDPLSLFDITTPRIPKGKPFRVNAGTAPMMLRSVVKNLRAMRQAAKKDMENVLDAAATLENMKLRARGNSGEMEEVEFTRKERRMIRDEVGKALKGWLKGTDKMLTDIRDKASGSLFNESGTGAADIELRNRIMVDNVRKIKMGAIRKMLEKKLGRKMSDGDILKAINEGGGKKLFDQYDQTFEMSLTTYQKSALGYYALGRARGGKGSKLSKWIAKKMDSVTDVEVAVDTAVTRGKIGKIPLVGYLARKVVGAPFKVFDTLDLYRRSAIGTEMMVKEGIGGAFRMAGLKKDGTKRWFYRAAERVLQKETTDEEGNKTVQLTPFGEFMDSYYSFRWDKYEKKYNLLEKRAGVVGRTPEHVRHIELEIIEGDSNNAINKARGILAATAKDIKKAAKEIGKELDGAFDVEGLIEKNKTWYNKLDKDEKEAIAKFRGLSAAYAKLGSGADADIAGEVLSLNEKLGRSCSELRRIKAPVRVKAVLDDAAEKLERAVLKGASQRYIEGISRIMGDKTKSKAEMASQMVELVMELAKEDPSVRSRIQAAGWVEEKLKDKAQEYADLARYAREKLLARLDEKGNLVPITELDIVRTVADKVMSRQGASLRKMVEDELEAENAARVKAGQKPRIMTEAEKIDAEAAMVRKIIMDEGRHDGLKAEISRFQRSMEELYQEMERTLGRSDAGKSKYSPFPKIDEIMRRANEENERVLKYARDNGLEQSEYFHLLNPLGRNVVGLYATEMLRDILFDKNNRPRMDGLKALGKKLTGREDFTVEDLNIFQELFSKGAGKDPFQEQFGELVLRGGAGMSSATKKGLVQLLMDAAGEEGGKGGKYSEEFRALARTLLGMDLPSGGKKADLRAEREAKLSLLQKMNAEDAWKTIIANGADEKLAGKKIMANLAMVAIQEQLLSEQVRWAGKIGVTMDLMKKTSPKALEAVMKDDPASAEIYRKVVQGAGLKEALDYNNIRQHNGLGTYGGLKGLGQYVETLLDANSRFNRMAALLLSANGKKGGAWTDSVLGFMDSNLHELNQNFGSLRAIYMGKVLKEFRKKNGGNGRSAGYDEEFVNDLVASIRANNKLKGITEDDASIRARIIKSAQEGHMPPEAHALLVKQGIKVKDLKTWGVMIKSGDMVSDVALAEYDEKFLEARYKNDDYKKKGIFERGVIIEAPKYFDEKSGKYVYVEKGAKLPKGTQVFYDDRDLARLAASIPTNRYSNLPINFDVEVRTGPEGEWKRTSSSRNRLVDTALNGLKTNPSKLRAGAMALAGFDSEGNYHEDFQQLRVYSNADSYHQGRHSRGPIMKQFEKGMGVAAGWFVVSYYDRMQKMQEWYGAQAVLRLTLARQAETMNTWMTDGPNRRDIGGQKTNKNMLAQVNEKLGAGKNRQYNEVLRRLETEAVEIDFGRNHGALNRIGAIFRKWRDSRATKVMTEIDEAETTYIAAKRELKALKGLSHTELGISKEVHDEIKETLSKTMKDLKGDYKKALKTYDLLNDIVIDWTGTHGTDALSQTYGSQKTIWNRWWLLQKISGNKFELGRITDYWNTVEAGAMRSTATSTGMRFGMEGLYAMGYDTGQGTYEKPELWLVTGAWQQQYKWAAALSRQMHTMVLPFVSALYRNMYMSSYAQKTEFEPSESGKRKFFFTPLRSHQATNFLAGFWQERMDSIGASSFIRAYMITGNQDVSGKGFKSWLGKTLMNSDKYNVDAFNPLLHRVIDKVSKLDEMLDNDPDLRSKFNEWMAAPSGSKEKREAWQYLKKNYSLPVIADSRPKDVQIGHAGHYFMNDGGQDRFMNLYIGYHANTWKWIVPGMMEADYNTGAFNVSPQVANMMVNAQAGPVLGMMSMPITSYSVDSGTNQVVSSTTDQISLLRDSMRQIYRKEYNALLQMVEQQNMEIAYDMLNPYLGKFKHRKAPLQPSENTKKFLQNNIGYSLDDLDYNVSLKAHNWDAEKMEAENEKARARREKRFRKDGTEKGILASSGYAVSEYLHDKWWENRIKEPLKERFAAWADPNYEHNFVVRSAVFLGNKVPVRANNFVVRNGLGLVERYRSEIVFGKEFKGQNNLQYMLSMENLAGRNWGTSYGSDIFLHI